MPSWNVHLEAGQRVAKKLKLSGQKRKEFLLGCLLPDINNGYINRVEIEKPHDSTHYAYDQKSSLNFYADYKKQIVEKDPIYLGYLLHLYTDGFFNYNFYHNIKRCPLGEGLDHDEKLKIKHHDFWIYDLNFNHRLEIKNLAEAKPLAESANKIAAVNITPKDILNVEKVLTDGSLNEYIKKEKYLYYTKEQLDDLLGEMLESFSEKYLGEKNA